MSEAIPVFSNRSHDQMRRCDLMPFALVEIAVAGWVMAVAIWYAD